VEAGRLVANHPCATEEAWLPWTLCVSVAEPGDYGNRRLELKTPNLALHWETFDLRCRLRGLSPPDSLAVVVPLRLGARSRSWGVPLGSGRLPAMLPGGVDMVVDSGDRHVVVLVKRALLRRYYRPERCAALEGAASTRFVPARPAEVERFGSWLRGLIENATQRPQALLWAEAPAALEDQVLGRLSEAIDLPRAAAVRPDASARRRGLERALEHLRVAHAHNVKVARLAEVAGVCPRTLEFAFHDAFDLTPAGFLRLLRLHAVRRELSASTREGTTVGQVANRNGFPQHGRFAAYYRQLFGESPSDTLRRSP